MALLPSLRNILGGTASRTNETHSRDNGTRAWDKPRSSPGQTPTGSLRGSPKTPERYTGSTGNADYKACDSDLHCNKADWVLLPTPVVKKFAALSFMT